MTNPNIRRVRLAQLIAEKYATQAAFIAATEESQSEVSGLLKEKSFGEKKARKIEKKCGLPDGWLDSAEMELPSESRIGSDLDDAVDLLNCFSKLSPKNKLIVLNMARGMVPGSVQISNNQGITADNKSK
ncbi:hypothetical protein [Glaciimonas immobilis]|uniref:Uncharacterized protein n=1 Tax=Glaciimonas immobilis TaxID=728004 RepID=A0A840RQU7_9BURK|nr:hypothetical protein [Glaciimonas immobilis]KAF3997350.1 hypothetical protein HAV38_12600 [Glaciimonas immobilis]MBB5200807.1 hypothetical protein [Glaciimonas immobilis]